MSFKGQNIGFTFLKWPKIGTFEAFGPVKKQNSYSGGLNNFN